jgi:hypothetical protein
MGKLRSTCAASHRVLAGFRIDGVGGHLHGVRGDVQGLRHSVAVQVSFESNVSQEPGRMGWEEMAREEQFLT